MVYLDLRESEEGVYAYRILNLYGEILKSGTSSNELVEVNISQLNSGLYIVNVSSEEGAISKNLIIQ